MQTLQQKLISTIEKRNVSLFEFCTQSHVSRVVYLRFMSGKRVKPISIKRIQQWIENGEFSEYNNGLQNHQELGSIANP
jgi:hypothetical protein